MIKNATPVNNVDINASSTPTDSEKFHGGAPITKMILSPPTVVTMSEIEAAKHAPNVIKVSFLAKVGLLKKNITIADTIKKIIIAKGSIEISPLLYFCIEM